MDISTRMLAKLKRSRAMLAEKAYFNPNILPPATDYLGIYNNNGSLRDLMTGAKFFQYDAVLGHRYRKNSAILFLRQNHTTVEKYLCITDQDGFVPNDLQFRSTKERLRTAKQQGLKTVFLFGGSTVAHCSGYLPNTEIAAHLERHLQDLYPNQYIVINAGVGGYATDNQFKYLIYDILPLQPDMVIFYDGWNDATYLNGLLSTYKDTYKRGSVQQSYSAQKLYESSMSVSKLLTLASRLALKKSLETIDFFNVLHRWLPKIALHPTGDSIKAREFNLASLSVYAANIHMSYAICAARNIKFMHFLQPLLITGNKHLSPAEQTILNNVPSNDRHLYREFYDTFEARTFEGATLLQNVQSISLRNLFDDETQLIYKDAGHIDSIGNKLVAKKIADYVRL